MATGTRLDSWKEIARYLGRDVRTVIRWEERGLPVHRIPGGKIPRVFAFTDELDAWLHQDAAALVPDPPADSPVAPFLPDPDARRPPAAWKIAVPVVVAAITLLGAWRLTRTQETPTRMGIVGQELFAYGASGVALWTHRVDGAMPTPPGVRWTSIADLDGDRKADITSSLNVMHHGASGFGGRLMRFSSSGSLAWAFEPDDRVTFRAGSYGAPWPGQDMTVYRANGETRIAWAVHHFTWWPGLLITLNARGERRGTFVNGGWIQMVRPSTDGRYLLLVGVENSRQAYFFAALDAAHPSGRSPEPPGSPTECVSCEAVDPLRYVVFPRTDVGGQQPFPSSGPSLETFDDGRVQIQTHESDMPNVAVVIYEFSRNLTLTDVRLSDSYWEWHRRLQSAATLQHDEQHCPARTGLQLQTWAPGVGWQSTRVPMH